MRILIDMDGVLADFEEEFLRRWRERFPNGSWVRPEDRRSFPLRGDYPEHLHAAIMEIINEDGFFAAFPVMDGAYHALETMLDVGIDARICTSPLLSSPTNVHEKVHWVDRHLGREWMKRLIITRDKAIVSAEILIDDRPEVEGAEPNPPWEHVYYDQPYNRRFTGRRRLTWSNWRSVLGV